MRILETVKAGICFFFPLRCVACDERLTETEDIICDRCRSDLRFIDLPDCPVCGAGAGKMPRRRGQPDVSRCPTCPSRKRPVYFDRCVSAVYYNDTAAETVKQLKFHRYFEAATLMARLMFIRMREDFVSLDFDYIIPVPLHPRRRRRRGYNQADCIARELGSLIKLPVADDLLVRIKSTKKQTDLSQEDRYFNVTDAFAVRDLEPVRGKNILLIDDVYTTGSTLNAAAKPLKLFGASNVVAFTFSHS